MKFSQKFQNLTNNNNNKKKKDIMKKYIYRFNLCIKSLEAYRKVLALSNRV